MGVFDDKKYEELDWISRAVEPIETELTKVLEALPDEHDIDFETYMSYVGESYSLDLGVDRVVHHLLAKQNIKLDWEDSDKLKKCFQLEVEPDTLLDFRSNTLQGSIRLVKVKNTFDEQELQNMLGAKGVNYMRSEMRHHRCAVGRLNEIGEILGKCDEMYKTRSTRRKVGVIIDRVKKILKEDEWKIKDVELANKLGMWITEYAIGGNLAAFTNFCKLKVMTHKGLPIYSMEEEV